MKALFLTTTAAAAFLLSAGGAGADSLQVGGHHSSFVNDDSSQLYQREEQDRISLQQLKEYKVLEEHLEVHNYEGKIMEDNPYKRVVILSDGKGKERYKSILIKNTQRLKVIDFKQGPIFNQVL
ncbi:hypothetical protein SAMN05192559_101872 [Halobacillus karajensis]|uniref:Uncharacterized protein n=1 Tax=Halobacillus karajensis TaxID=195088 RepID=A0A059NZ90_9BACI|nr:hypothetical protein [Halobacillus karajensis]CDQ18516.1 hypothetical protein BN982_00789 [Halobacillus karajensis]CDQ23412.1 hypothetical protein BN983_01639 [Halobacillus karajensis]CDQ26894.1 hypothetical protein BN981_01119 [Halobacillus karajensis]SEH50497.1 hypothetical protein SAMN05192559_101872 [Halobacillus karajensis]